MKKVITNADKAVANLFIFVSPHVIFAYLVLLLALWMVYVYGYPYQKLILGLTYPIQKRRSPPGVQLTHSPTAPDVTR